MFADPSVISENREICDCGPAVETYVRRSTLVFEILVRIEAGAQVKDVCGGSAYEVINLEEEICSGIRRYVYIPVVYPYII